MSWVVVLETKKEVCPWRLLSRGMVLVAAVMANGLDMAFSSFLFVLKSCLLYCIREHLHRKRTSCVRTEDEMEQTPLGHYMKPSKLLVCPYHSHDHESWPPWCPL